MKRLALILTSITLTRCANLTPQQNEALTAAGGIILQAGAQRQLVDRVDDDVVGTGRLDGDDLAGPVGEPGRDLNAPAVPGQLRVVAVPRR